MEITSADIGRRIKVAGYKGVWVLGAIKDDENVVAFMSTGSPFPQPTHLVVSKNKVSFPKTFIVSSYCRSCGRGETKRVKN